VDVGGRFCGTARIVRVLRAGSVRLERGGAGNVLVMVPQMAHGAVHVGAQATEDVPLELIDLRLDRAVESRRAAVQVGVVQRARGRETLVRQNHVVRIRVALGEDERIRVCLIHLVRECTIPKNLAEI